MEIYNMENDSHELEKITIHKKMIMLMKYRREILWDIMGDIRREEQAASEEQDSHDIVNTFDTESIPF